MITVNVIQVLTITTALYFVFVGVWLTRMEDYLQMREENYEEETSSGVTASGDR